MKALLKYYSIILAALCWAISFVWVKIAYIDFTPIGLITLRVTGAALMFFLIGLTFKSIQPIKRKDLKYFIYMAFFEPFLYFMGESHGLLIISSTFASVIISTIPLFTPVASYFLLKEKIGSSLLIGIVFSLLGIFIMEYAGGMVQPAPLKGILLMFVAVFSASLFPVFLKKLTANYSNTTILAYQNLFGVIMFLPFFLRNDLRIMLKTDFSNSSLLALAGLTVFSSVLAFIFYTDSIKKLGVSKSNVFINLIPVMTAIMAFSILGDPLGWYKVAGILIVIAGLFISQINFKRFFK